MKRSISPWTHPALLASLGVALATLSVANAQPGSGAPAKVVPASSGAAKTAPVAKTVPVATTAPVATATPAAKPAKPAKLDPAKVIEDLARPETLSAGLAAVASAGPAAKKLAPHIEELLSKGLPPEHAASAMGALAAIGAPGSSVVVAPYVKHRSAAVRKAAALALGRTGGPAAEGALRAALRSTDAALRAAAASALGSAGDEGSVPDLLRALDLQVIEAAPSIAALCSGARCDELLARWEKLPSETRRATLAAFLKRRPALPDDVLLRAVGMLKAAEGASAKGVFHELKASFKGSSRVRAALEAASKGGKP